MPKVVQPSQADHVVQYFNGTPPVAATFAAAQKDNPKQPIEQKEPGALDRILNNVLLFIVIVVAVVWNRKKLF